MRAFYGAALLLLVLSGAATAQEVEIESYFDRQKQVESGTDTPDATPTDAAAPNDDDAYNALLTRIEDGLKRIDGAQERLLANTETLQQHEKQIEDGAVHLFDLVVRVDTIEERFRDLLGQVRQIGSRVRQGPTEEQPTVVVGDNSVHLYLGVALVLLAIVFLGGAIPLAGGLAGFGLLGAGLVFGPTINGMIGHPQMALTFLTETGSMATVKQSIMIEMTLAGVAAWLIAAAARIPARGCIMLSAVIGGVLYPVLAHWMLFDAPGMLARRGFEDTGAAARVALFAGVVMLAFRRPAPDKAAGTPYALGALWLGVLLLTASNGAVLNTAMAAAFSLAGAVIGHALRGGTDQEVVFSALAGLVASVGASTASPLDMLLVGAVAGLAFQMILSLRNTVDILSCIAVAVTAGGFVGTIAPGIVSPGGLIRLFSFEILVAQVIGAFAVIAFGFVTVIVARRFAPAKPTSPRKSAPKPVAS